MFTASANVARICMNSHCSYEWCVTLTFKYVGGVDYESGPYNVTFPAGATRVSFNISIYDDDLPEGNENFSLTINADSLPDGIINGSPSTVMMIIRNDDSKCANCITIYVAT